MDLDREGAYTFDREYPHTIDDKGRLTLPVKYREALGERYMISKGMETCLFVYPQAEWDKLAEKLNALPIFNPKARNVKRRFFSGACAGETDRQGRTMINQELRNFAGLRKDVYVVGAGDHAEIWDKTAWEVYRAELDANYEALAEELFQ
ncbi:MAG: division/cell wall cluster transcriptional repressor MraZ [Peptococcaceae bacterium]|jgi:MraZ protein|nr:division/cell wall cluster transcriptional repressor MraZ [Peptococcaceae bacterium]